MEDWQDQSPLPPGAAPADELNEESSAVRAQESARGECAERGKSAGQQMTHWDCQNSERGALGNLALGRRRSGEAVQRRDQKWIPGISRRILLGILMCGPESPLLLLPLLLREWEVDFSLLETEPIRRQVFGPVGSLGSFVMISLVLLIS